MRQRLRVVALGRADDAPAHDLADVARETSLRSKLQEVKRMAKKKRIDGLTDEALERSMLSYGDDVEPGGVMLQNLSTGLTTGAKR